MNGLTLSTLRPSPGVAPTRRAEALVVSPSATLTASETARIADVFPARPQVAQKLYGPGRQVQQAPQLGTRLDLSA